MSVAKGVKVREARLPEERGTLEAFVLALNVYEHAFEPNRRTDAAVGPDYYSVLTKFVAEHDGRIFVAEGSGGQVVGWTLTIVDEEPNFVREEGRRYGLIAELFVTEHARGAGVGRALVQAAEDDFRARDIKIAMIGVMAGNARARAAYEAWGFKPNSSRLRKYL